MEIENLGRTYADFLAFMEEHPDLPVTEMDTAIGAIGSKVILTTILTLILMGNWK